MPKWMVERIVSTIFTKEVDGKTAEIAMSKARRKNSDWKRGDQTEQWEASESDDNKIVGFKRGS